MIVTLINDKINIKITDFVCTFSSDELDEMLSNGLIRRKNVSYKLFINNKELLLKCPMLKSLTDQNIVLWPSFKLPFRKYPIYIYLYSIALYLSSKMSMRDVAAHVKNKFGLDKFSHSTISRTLKKLSNIVDLILDILPANNQVNSGLILKPTDRKSWDTTHKEKYYSLLQVLLPVLDIRQVQDYSCLLNYKYFKKYQKFII